jgi:hypothetical protein
MALTLGNIDKSLTAPATSSSEHQAQSFHDDSLPVPLGLLDHTIVNTMAPKPIKEETERRVLRPRQNRRPSRHHVSDSGLGTSVADSGNKPTEESTIKRETRASHNAQAITRSAAASDASSSEGSARLSSKATNKIQEHVLKPLLSKASLKDFHPIVLDCPRRIQEKEIVCLRDLEKTLMFMAPERTKTADLYLDFCLTSIRCIQATVEFLHEREQTRPHDRPYTNGYFIDLVEQITQYAKQLSDAKDTDDMDPADEIRLHGGLTKNGQPAELVRVKKNGKAYSIATGEVIEQPDDDVKGPIKFKRSMSQTLEDDEEIMRSMARRKKNPTPEELAPKKCKEPGCNKEFKRPCDLTKHEKTHSRPWKCPVPSCKYHEYGWPTEKEMDRHHNDKHSDSPAMFQCHFSHCPYKSKRESNCKQHMEKAHDWTYVRTKTNGKKSDSHAPSTTHPTPVMQNMPTPISDQGIEMSPPMVNGMHDSNILFPTYELHPLPVHGFPDELADIHLRDMDVSPLSSDTPPSDAGHGLHFPYQEMGGDFAMFDDIYAAPARIAHPSIPVNNQGFGIKNSLQHPFSSFTDASMMDMDPASHISPIGEGNVMLFTPKSMVDEGFDEYPAGCEDGDGDFLLFDGHVGSGVAKRHNDGPMGPALFGEIPSLAAGYSQPSSQDFEWHQPHKLEWQPDFDNFSGHH